jgi:hypothetical protein
MRQGPATDANNPCYFAQPHSERPDPVGRAIISEGSGRIQWEEPGLITAPCLIKIICMARLENEYITEYANNIKKCDRGCA